MGGLFNSPRAVVIAYSIGSMYVFSMKYVLSTTKSLIQDDLKLPDTQAGALYTMFLLAMLISSPIIGYIADVSQKYKKHIAIWGLVLNGCSICACSICFHFSTLIIPRILAGVGDGTFSTIAPAILSDYFPPSKRNMVLTTFFSISNLGAVFGYALSAFLGDLVGWRSTCVLLGLPSILGLVLFVFDDPEPNATMESTSMYEKIDIENDNSENVNVNENENNTENVNNDSVTSKNEIEGTNPASKEEEKVETKLDMKEQLKKFMKEMQMIFSAPFVVSVIGFLFHGISIAAIADWGTSFLIRYYDLTITYAGTFCGSVIVVCAFVGTALGGFICEYAGKVIHRHPHLFVSGITLFASSIFLLPPTIPTDIDSAAFPCVLNGIAFILCYINYGPMNAYVVNCVTPELRSRAIGITNTFRNFGGCIAPSIIGAISDASYGDLRSALLITPFSNAIGGIVWLLATITIPKEYGPKMTLDEESDSDYRRVDLNEPKVDDLGELDDGPTNEEL